MKFFRKKLFTTLISAFSISLAFSSCGSSKGETIPTEKVETVIEAEKIPPKEFLYSVKLKTSVYDSPETKKVVDTIGQNTRVLVAERKDIEIIKEVKGEGKKENSQKPVPVKPKKEEKPFINDDEKVKITFTEPQKENIKEEAEKVTENIPEVPKEYEHWVHVKYRRNLKEREGWILENNLHSDVFKNLPKSWKGMELNNFPEKVEFPDNPRVDVKGVYLTVYSASSEKKIESLIELAKETKINAFVIDVKDDGGQLLWKMDDSILKYNQKAFSKVYIKDINAFMKKMKDNNIYTIARIVSFKDPVYAKQNPDKAIIEKKTGKPFTNKDGVIWVSPHDKNL